MLCCGTSANKPIWVNSMLRRELHYLSVCRRYVPTSVDPQQCVVWERQVELDVGRMVHSHMKPPKKSRRDCLTLLGSNVDLATVDGPASYPLLCRWKPQTGDIVKLPTADLLGETGSSIQYQREQLITNPVSSNISLISRRANQLWLNRHWEWLNASENPAFQEALLSQSFG